MYVVNLSSITMLKINVSKVASESNLFHLLEKKLQSNFVLTRFRVKFRTDENSWNKHLSI